MRVIRTSDWGISTYGGSGPSFIMDDGDLEHGEDSQSDCNVEELIEMVITPQPARLIGGGRKCQNSHG